VRLEPGIVLAERYRLERQLGEGGMGAVWAAKHTVTNKVVALKILLGRGEDQALRERLLREARAVCAIQHAHVVPVHDVLELEDGAPALVMDLLVGESLRQKLDRVGRLGHDEVARVAIDVLSALEAAHARGIIHRDLKPDNVFLSRAPDGREEVKVLDFGIAKVTTLGENDSEAAALTKTDSMLGTPYYMAPEQVYGEKDIDARSDLWAMGVLMYECLAGVRPTEANNLGQIFKLITIGPIAPLAEKAPNVPASFAKVVGWCLERTRDARPSGARDLRDALERVRAGSSLDGAAISAHVPQPPPAFVAPPKGGGGRVAAIVAGAVVVLAVVAGGVGIGMKSRRTSPATATVVTEAPPAPPPVQPAAPPAPSPAEIASAPPAAPTASTSSPIRTAKPTKIAPKAAPGAAAPASEDERAAGKVIAKPPF
jgi:eukaryotic-like serine/threonine-protein kinase